VPVHTEAEVAALVAPNTPKLIDPWLAAGAIALVFGPPSAGKSLWSATLAREVARGGTLYGAYPCARSRVLVIQADMPTEMVVERVQASSVPPSPNVQYWLTNNAPLDVLKLAKTHKAELAQARAFAPELVIVDTLRKTHSLDENDSAAPDRVYSAWREAFPGAVFVFLHHSRKIPMNATSADAMIRESFRGSIAWAAGADTLIAIRRVRQKGNKDWLAQMLFVRTRGTAEPPGLRLRKTADLTLEATEETLETRLFQWLADNAPEKHEAVKWLQSLTDKRGRPLCSRATAYRMFDRVSHAA
jgi:hypothetical protein